jgi:hypothetical protein
MVSALLMSTAFPITIQSCATATTATSYVDLAFVVTMFSSPSADPMGKLTETHVN